MAVFAKAGVRAYYGPNVLTPIAQPVALDQYTKEAITKCLFSTEIIGDVSACAEYTNIEWRNVGKEEMKWVSNTGYKKEEENMLVKFLKYEARREDIPVLSNVDFVHRTPMTVIPMGAMAEIDCG